MSLYSGISIRAQRYTILHCIAVNMSSSSISFGSAVFRTTLAQKMSLVNVTIIVWCLLNGLSSRFMLSTSLKSESINGTLINYQSMSLGWIRLSRYLPDLYIMRLVAITMYYSARIIRLPCQVESFLASETDMVSPIVNILADFFLATYLTSASSVLAQNSWIISMR